MTEIAVEPAGAPVRRRSRKAFGLVFVAVQVLFVVAIAVVAAATATPGAAAVMSVGVLLMFGAWFLVDLVLGAAYTVYLLAKS